MPLPLAARDRTEEIDTILLRMNLIRSYIQRSEELDYRIIIRYQSSEDNIVMISGIQSLPQLSPGTNLPAFEFTIEII